MLGGKDIIELIESKIQAIEAREPALVAYMKSKIDYRDWHAIRDVCTDLESMEAAVLSERGTVEVLRRLLKSDGEGKNE